MKSKSLLGSWVPASADRVSIYGEEENQQPIPDWVKKALADSEADPQSVNNKKAEKKKKA